MGRFIKFASSAICSDAELVVEMDEKDILVAILEIDLLIMGYADQLKIEFSGGVTLDISIEYFNEQVKWSSFDVSGQNVIVRFALNQIEYLRSFFLNAYKNGYAEVEHIHVEGNKGDKDFDLTFFFSNYMPPLSSVEAEKLMDK